MIIKNINNTDTVISCSYFHLNFLASKTTAYFQFFTIGQFQFVSTANNYKTHREKKKRKSDNSNVFLDLRQL